MKLRNIFVPFLFIGMLAAGMLTSCSDEEEGKPVINYIRVTDPAIPDSLLVKANQNQMILIMGENLSKTREIWFNDLKAELITSYITNTSIITRVPQELPGKVTNTMKLIFANGDSLIHPFTLDVSKPHLKSMVSEYVNAGEIATIKGNYFYGSVKVIFNGGAEAEIVELEDEVIQIKVPEGAQPGPITVESSFGSSKSGFFFRDNRNIISGFDGDTTGLSKGKELIRSSDAHIENVNGKFMRLQQFIGGWQWWEMYVAPQTSGIALETKNIPQAAFANPSAYSFKFEINTLKPLTGAQLKMFIGPDAITNRDQCYFWTPTLDTQGQWQTISIPFDQFYGAINTTKQFVYNPNGYGVFFLFHGPNPVDADFAIDNFRVVPN